MRHAFCNTRMKFVAGAVLLSLASVSFAQSATLVGGGATLPAAGYAGNTANRLMTPSTGTLLAAYGSANGVGTTYCQTGSGGGKNILAGSVSGFNVNAACDGTSPIGFGGTGLSQPHFVGSDSPLSASDYSNYLAGHTATGAQPVQAPAVAGAIAVVFNKPQVRALRLNESQVCQIFSGKIKNWEDAALASAIVPMPGQTVTGPIKIAYRSDGSGTSFAFTNHLSAKCGTDATFGGNGQATQFQTNQDYATAAAAYLSSYSSSVGASGNPGVITAIGANQGSIGYAETANSVQSGTQRASISNDSAATTFVDPATFGGPLPVTVTYDKIIGSNNAAGRPQLASLSPAPAVAQCVAVVDPAAYAVPASGYPIVAVSYFLVNAKGNGADLAHVQSLLISPYNTTVRSNVTKIGAGQGLSFLTAPGIDSSFASRCVTQ
ncbi:hypothetical protein GCM10009552_34310 [Rothia nasimurium]|uniref:Extracellular solute-binding protein n=1 Tax=Luteibacter anthropi TaxID=564369 RepID=A0A7X5U8J8_9GAMM|nr:substrate-binding domain-containing protein [Luteibacter anthropi]NII05785.1 extracellular solute-binding protein [Luteibacter anthropi]